MADPVYRSQIDRWLLTVFGVSSAVSLLTAIGMFFVGASASTLVMVPVLVATFGLPWWIVLTTDYTVTNYSIEIRSGPFHWSVPLRDISRMEFTRSPLSSPALSLDRLRIQYTAGKLIMISPENREKFLADLRRRGVHAEVSR